MKVKNIKNHWNIMRFTIKSCLLLDQQVRHFMRSNNCSTEILPALFDVNTVNHNGNVHVKSYTQTFLIDRKNVVKAIESAKPSTFTPPVYHMIAVTMGETRDFHQGVHHTREFHQGMHHKEVFLIIVHFSLKVSRVTMRRPNSRGCPAPLAPPVVSPMNIIQNQFSVKLFLL